MSDASDGLAAFRSAFDALTLGERLVFMGDAYKTGVLDGVTFGELMRRVGGVVEDLVDGEPCELDHDGGCQTHAWFGDGECSHARARRLLDGWGAGA